MSSIRRIIRKFVIASVMCFVVLPVDPQVPTVPPDVKNLISDVTMLFKLFGQNNDTSTATQMQQILVDDKLFISRLDFMTSELQQLHIDLQQIDEDNKQSWQDWISFLMEKSITAYVMENAAYAKLSPLSPDDAQNHRSKISDINGQLTNEVNLGSFYGSAVALPLSLAILTEENSASQIDPDYANPDSRLTMARRIETLTVRIGTLKSLLDLQKQSSLTRVLADDDAAIAAYGPTLANVDADYLNRNLILDQNSQQETSGASGMQCMWYHITSHFIRVSGNRDDGYSISATGTMQTDTKPQCRRNLPVCRTCLDVATPKPLLPVPPLDPASSVKDWSTLFNSSYIPMQEEYSNSKQGRAILPQVIKQVATAQSYLEQRLKTLQATCQKMSGIDCSTGKMSM